VSSTVPAAFARSRAHVYDLLAAAFDGQADVLVLAIEDGAFAELADVLPMEPALGSLDGTAPDAESLEIGYDNLFAVPGPHYVPPVASSHAGGSAGDLDSDSAYRAADGGTFFGDPARRMAERYEQVGFEPGVGDGLPDHVAAELAFLSALASAIADRHEGGDGGSEELATLETLERETLAEMEWLDSFASAVADQDRGDGVYADLARFAASFVRWDADGRVEDGGEPVARAQGTRSGST